MIYYVSYENGNDATGDGSFGNPYRTWKGCDTAVTITGADEIRIEKTSAQTTTSVATCTFTDGSRVVTTSASLVGIVAVGDVIGKSTATGNGRETNDEGLYRVDSITSGSITINNCYYGTTAAVGTIRVVTPFAEADDDPFDTCDNGETTSGGWTLATQVRDGETWIAPSGVSSTDQVVWLSNGGVMEYMNFVGGERGSRVDGGGIFRYCTQIYGGYGNVRCWETGTVEYCWLSTCRVSNYTYGNEVRQNCTLFDNNIVVGRNDTGSYVGVWLDVIGVASIHDKLVGTTNIVRHCRAGISISDSNDFDLGGMELKDCTYGVYSATAGVKVRNAMIEACTSGVYLTNTQGHLHVSDMTITGCTNGILFGNTNNAVVEDITFENNGSDVTGGAYMANVIARNCRHSTPTSYAYNLSSYQMGTIYLYGCSIDAGSLSKAMNNPASTIYIGMPRYVCIGSFGYNGSFWANGSCLQDNTVLSPSGDDSYKITYNTTITRVMRDLKIGACYVGLNQGKNCTIQYKMGNIGWVGSFIPKLKLNGVVVTTGATVNTATTDWTSLGISVAGSSITAPGELSLEIEMVANTYPIYFGDFEAVG